MIVSEIIGLAALLLVLIFFYTRIIFPKLRSVFILILAFASAGLVGYSSASSIGIGWTVSLALLIFLGVAISVIFLQKREDRDIAQHFELALKSDQAPLAASIADVAPPPLLSPAEEEQEPSHVSTASAMELAGEHLDAPDTAEVEASEEEKEAYVAISLLSAEQPKIQVAEHPAGEEISSNDPFKEDTPSAMATDHPCATSEEVLPESEPRHEHVDLEIAPETVLAAIVQHDQPVKNEPVTEPAEVIRAEEFHTEKPAPKAEPIDRTRIQALSAEAELALQQSDYLRAYQSLREALSYSPPVMATYILSRQLVQVLNEMGLYEESISVMEKVLNESPTLSAKKREEFIRHISYLEELIRQLQLENKRNLSWSLVPPAIHEKVITQFRTLVASNYDRSTAIPFH